MGEYTYIQDPHNLYTVYDFLDAIKDYIPKDEGIEFEELHSFYPRIREEKLRELIKNDDRFTMCENTVFTV